MFFTILSERERGSRHSSEGRLGASLARITARKGSRIALLSGYSYNVLQTMPGPAPNGGEWAFDFEPGDIDNNGDVIFTSDLPRMAGIGRAHSSRTARGRSLPLAFPGDTLPGGVGFGASSWARTRSTIRATRHWPSGFSHSVTPSE